SPPDGPEPQLAVKVEGTEVRRPHLQHCPLAPPGPSQLQQMTQKRLSQTPAPAGGPNREIVDLDLPIQNPCVDVRLYASTLGTHDPVAGERIPFDFVSEIVVGPRGGEGATLDFENTRQVGQPHRIDAISTQACRPVSASGGRM